MNKDVCGGAKGRAGVALAALFLSLTVASCLITLSAGAAESRLEATQVDILVRGEAINPEATRIIGAVQKATGKK